MPKLSDAQFQLLVSDIENLASVLGFTSSFPLTGVTTFARLKLKEQATYISKLESENRKLKAEIQCYERSQG